jgi:hypothetical protein
MFRKQALPYLEKHRIIGDIPGSIPSCFILSSFGAPEKAYGHLALALDVDKEVFPDFSDIFPPAIFTRKIRKLLDNHNLL